MGTIVPKIGPITGVSASFATSLLGTIVPISRAARLERGQPWLDDGRWAGRGPAPLTLDPPGGGRLLADHDAVEERGGFRQSFFGRQDAVLMLDREHVIVAEHAERRDEFAPPLLAVAVAAGAEDPRAMALIGVTLGIQHARQRQ